MTREAEPELDLGLPAPNASTSVTERPDSRKRSAVQLPKAPAPTTTQSGKRHSSAHRKGAGVCQLRRGHVFDSLAQRLENDHLVFRGAARHAPGQHFAQLASDVAGAEMALRH